MKKNINNFGFTLVELLIVITLISILAVAIVATLNPVEQVNRARDAKYKNDASEYLAAIERYYASTQDYPWVAQDATMTTTDAFNVIGEAGGLGVCNLNADGRAISVGDCTTDGAMIASDELKSQFRSKDQFASDVIDQDRFFVHKAAADSSVYVCFIPKANVNHTPTTQVKLWDLGMYGAGATALPSCITTVTTAQAALAVWADRNDSYLICVPE